MSYSIGILDQTPVIENLTNHEIFQRTVQLAKQAENWGYKRFWVSEHHNSEKLLGSSPEVLISYLLAKTNSIRIGSGGVMLQHYSSYKVAENFNVLATLEPGRVDVGIGKAPGGDPLAIKALQYGTLNNGKVFEEKLSVLVQLLKGEISESHPLAGIKVIPEPPKHQEIILLGGSPNSAILAKELGITFSFASFLNGERKRLAEAVNAYCKENKKKRFILAVAVIASENSEEAKRLANEQPNQVKIHFESGRTITTSSVDAAVKFGKEAGEEYEITSHKPYIIAGTPDEVKNELDYLHQHYDVDEFILSTPVSDYEVRYKTFKLLSPNSILQIEQSVK